MCTPHVVDLVKILLQAGGNPSKCDNLEEYPLHRVVLLVRHSGRCQECIQLLIGAGASPGAIVDLHITNNRIN